MAGGVVLREEHAIAPRSVGGEDIVLDGRN
jgi:hypothetical protein